MDVKLCAINERGDASVCQADFQPQVVPVYTAIFTAIKTTILDENL